MTQFKSKFMYIWTITLIGLLAISFIATRTVDSDTFFSLANGECEGSIDLVVGEDLVRHFSRDFVQNEKVKMDAQTEAIKKAQTFEIKGAFYQGQGNETLSDSYYVIVDGDYDKAAYDSVLEQFKGSDTDFPREEDFNFGDHFISRRPTKAAAESYIHSLQHMRKRAGKGTRLPVHV